MNIETDNPTLVHMLGYINIQQWVDAVCQTDGINKDLMFELLKQIDIRYDTDMVTTVTERMNRP